MTYIKYIRRIAKMELKKICALSCLAFFGLTGCSGQYTWWGSGDTTGEEVVYRDDNAPVQALNGDPCVQEEQVKPIFVTPDEEEQFIDYRHTATEYRGYGERTPRDQHYTQGAAGNNISATIPPTIDEEVADYESAVDSALNEAGEDNVSDDGTDSGDEAVEDWLAEEGNTLRGLLTEWSERAGWRLVWKSNRNYTLSAGAMFRGRFADVSSALIRSFARARPAPLATFYKGNRVLVVETKEDENAYN